jgi:hypothetical protein
LELDNRCERCRRGRCDTSAEESDESEQIRHRRPISKTARRNFEQRRLEESEDEDEGECFSRLRCGDCCEAPIILTTGNDDLKDGEVLSPYRSVYRPFRGAELAKEFGRGYDSEPCAVHSDCGGLSGRTASSCSCELCKQHGLAQADVCDQCGGCKASCCLVLVTPCVDCSRCPGALDGISMVCREGCGRCTDCCSLCEGCSGCFGSSNLCPQCDRCEDCCKGCPNPVDHLEDTEEPLAETLERRKSREEAIFDSVFLSARSVCRGLEGSRRSP